MTIQSPSEPAQIDDRPIGVAGKNKQRLGYISEKNI